MRWISFLDGHAFIVQVNAELVVTFEGTTGRPFQKIMIPWLFHWSAASRNSLCIWCWFCISDINFPYKGCLLQKLWEMKTKSIETSSRISSQEIKSYPHLAKFPESHISYFTLNISYFTSFCDTSILVCDEWGRLLLLNLLGIIQTKCSNALQFISPSNLILQSQLRGKDLWKQRFLVLGGG